ncbi:MAG: EAL domain-containing protein [Pseudomonadota bacterium]|nr:EAL domain-containing protein [Pseudomonadota bacterium]
MLQPLRNLKIKTKLALFLLIPFLSIAYFAGATFLSKYSQYQSAQITHNTLQLNTLLAELIHSAQKERGLSAGYIGSKGVRFKQALFQQRQQTNQIIEKIQVHIQSNPYPNHISQKLSILKKHAANRNKIRNQVDKLHTINLNHDKIFKHYSTGIQLILNTVESLQNFYQDNTLLKQGDAFTTLLWLSEKAGQERGRLNQVFAQQQLTVGVLQEVAAYIELQSNLLSKFSNAIDGVYQGNLADLIGEHQQPAFHQLRASALSKFTRMDLLNRIYSEIGYGGLIHDFKNYVIRGNDMYAVRFQRRLTNIINIIDQYLKLPGISSTEVLHLSQLEQVFQEYQTNLDVIKQMHRQQKTVKAIDDRVKVNDDPALQALNWLKKEVTDLDTELWWNLATQRINRIIHAEQQQLLNMQNHANELVAEAQRVVIYYALLILFAFVVSGWLAYQLARRLVYDVVAMSENVKGMIKENKFNDSLDSSGEDEISDLANSFNQLMYERNVYENLIWSQANYDHLTNLPNRKFCLDLLTNEIHHAARDKTKISVLFLDLDHFKAVNDTYGHASGDSLLIQVAKRIQSRIRNTDIVAHLSGDEFIIVLTHQYDFEDTEAITKKLIKTLSQPFELESAYQVQISASVGISLYPEDGTTASELISNADTAMYQAKKAGKNTFRFFTEEMNIAIQTRLTIERELKTAIQENQFQLHYQPIINTQTNEIKEVEALLRWQHPDKGLLYPEEFIHVAEQSGLIKQIGDWVLQQSMKDVSDWHQLHQIRSQLSINISSKQCSDHCQTLINQVSEYAEQTQFDLSRLNLEITEHTLMDYSENVAKNMHAFRNMGIGLHLDDFGTGYSSLSYLKRLPMDTLKIDAVFVRDIFEDDESKQLVQAIIGMAKSLKLDVIAEGIETPEQCDFLEAQGCQLLQGYLISKALPADECLKFIQNHQAKPAST